MPVIEINGAELAYLEQGQGEPLVFVHGSLEDYRSWRMQVDEFANYYRVITYSRRYHYPNAAAGDAHDYSAVLHASDLAALIRALDAGPAHMVGSSYGGYVALCLAGDHPDLVRTLVLGEPPIVPWLLETPEGAPWAEAFEAEVRQPANRAFDAGDLAGGVRLFLDGVMGWPTFERMMESSRAMPMDNAMTLRAELRAPEFFSPFTCADAARIDCPALLLDGERSPRLFYLVSDRLAECLPHAVRGVIPGTSHAMHLGNPDAYNAVVLAFLAQQGR